MKIYMKESFNSEGTHDRLFLKIKQNKKISYKTSNDNSNTNFLLLESIG